MCLRLFLIFEKNDEKFSHNLQYIYCLKVYKMVYY